MRFRGLLVPAILWAVTACGGDDGDGGTGPDEVPDGDVLVRNNTFTPSALEVETGTTVLWAWASGGTEHNVTFDDAVTSGNRGGGTFERTFGAAGSFPYHCTIHGPSMSGTVTVTAGAPADGGDGGGGGGGGGGGNTDPGDPGYPGGS